MLSIVRRNFQLKVFAFALAFVAWAYFRFSANPNMTARFDQQLSVPIVITGLRAGYVARYTEKFALVTIDATRNSVPIKPDQVEAVLNVANFPDPGVFNVPVQVIAPALQLRSLTPASVTLSIDRIEERVLPLSISYGSEARNLVVESTQLTPSRVSLRGVGADLSRVGSVRVVIPLPSKAATLDAMIRPMAVNTAGEEVSAVQVSPNLIRVRTRVIHSTGSGSH